MPGCNPDICPWIGISAFSGALLSLAFVGEWRERCEVWDAKGLGGGGRGGVGDAHGQLLAYGRPPRPSPPQPACPGLNIVNGLHVEGVRSDWGGELERSWRGGGERFDRPYLTHPDAF